MFCELRGSQLKGTGSRRTPKVTSWGQPGMPWVAIYR